MKYHINTILIWDSFKKQDDKCPLCQIEKTIEKQLINRYLNEAVMEDTCRKEVNKYGFCKKHFVKLYGGENKLGIALQTHTRYKELQKSFLVTDNYKTALKLAENLDKELSQCIICKLIDFNIEGYYKTLPQMYNKDTEFKKLFMQNKGFCINHYKKLLIYSKYAKTSTKQYLNDLTTLQQKNMDRIEKDILFFTEKFDYRNAHIPWGNKKEALKKCINNICGEIIEN